MEKGMKIVAVTGLICSGKSTIAKALAAELGCALFDCDSECARIIAKEDFRSVFGFSLDSSDIAAKKRFISDYVFVKPQVRERYERFVWDLCAKVFDGFVEKENAAGAKHAVLDAPLLFQSGMDARADYLVLARCPVGTRLERWMASGKARKDFEIRNRLQEDFFQENSRRIRNEVSVVLDNGSAFGERFGASVRAVAKRIGGESAQLP